jgi:hypothetical protein
LAVAFGSINDKEIEYGRSRKESESTTDAAFGAPVRQAFHPESDKENSRKAPSTLVQFA